jgi:lipopolysaccharide heptosyltransferase II
MPLHASTHAEMREPGYDVRPVFDARLARRLARLTKRIAQALLWPAIGAAGYGARPGVPSQRGAARGPVRRILVVRVDLLGDVVLTLPAVRALRRAYPEAAIDLLVLKSTAAVLAGDPDITRVLACDPSLVQHPWKLLREENRRELGTLLRTLRAARYDLALSVCGDVASILARLAAPRRSFGYAREAYPFLLTDSLPGGRYHTRQHEVRYVLDLAAAAGGIVLPEDAQPRLSVAPEAAARMGNVLARARAEWDARGPVVAIHVGARNGQAKRWPPAHIAALAERLTRELDALVTLTGAPNEAELAAAVVRRGGARVLNLVGQTTVPELAALLAASDLCVSGDSGPMHVACAVGTPVVVLHGPTDPGQSGPTAPDAIVLRRELWCAPCYDPRATAECRFGNPVCMKELAPALVFAAARRQLARHGWDAARAKSGRPLVLTTTERVGAD